MNGATQQANYDAEFCSVAKRGMAAAGLTYEALGEAIGENPHTVWNWFNGRTLFPAKALPALAIIGISEPLQKAASLCQCDLTPASRFLRKKHPVKPLRAHALDLVSDLARVTDEVNQALADNNRVDARENTRVVQAGTKLIEQTLLLIHRFSESVTK